MTTTDTTTTLSSNLTTVSSARVTTTVHTTTAGLFDSGAGLSILVLLIIIILLLVLVPLLAYIIFRKHTGRKTHPTNSDDGDTVKETQTDVIGLELQEFYQRRKPLDMSKYFGKKLPEVTEEYPRFNQLHPNEWNDPWTMKYSGKETERVGKTW